MKWIAKITPLFRMVNKIIPYTHEKALKVGAVTPENIVHDNPLLIHHVILEGYTQDEVEDKAYRMLGVE